MRLHLPPLLLASALATLIAPGRAAANHEGGGEIKMELRIPEAADDEDFQPRDEVTVREYFNLAHCICEAPFQVRFSLEDEMSVDSGARAFIRLGTQCDESDPEIANLCADQGELGLPEINRVADRVYSTKELVNGAESEECPFNEETRSVYAIISDNDTFGEEGDHPYTHDIVVDTEPPPEPDDLEATGGESSIVVSWELPETRPDDIRFFQLLCARADGSAVPSDDFPREKPRYLISREVCGMEDGTTPVLPTALALPDMHDGGVPDGGVPDGGVPDAGPPRPDAAVSSDLPLSLSSLSSSTVCGEANGTDNQLRVDGLENGVPYHIVLAVIDPSRNVTAFDLGVHTPQPVVDGWEHYKNSGGEAEGGYCFVATTTYGNYDHPYVRVLRDFRDDTLANHASGRAIIDFYYEHGPGWAAFLERHPVLRAIAGVLLLPVVAAAAVWEYTGPLGKLALLVALVLVVRLRRSVRARQTPRAARSPSSKRRRAVAAIAATGVLLIAASSSAQPYWEEYNEDIQDEPGEPKPNWNLELKVGPYHPDVDDEFDVPDGEKGPFESVYGDGPWLIGLVAIDRFFIHSFGQLGVSVSAGYLSQKANAFEINENGDLVRNSNGDPIRSKGDKTAFRLVPTSLSAVYRLTQLDDYVGVPLVPYGKLGLAYYIWWMTQPNGNIAEVPTPSCPDANMAGSDCTGDEARGGSLGWQATVGVALRAERLDPDAATSLRNELGVEHAGFFAEAFYADVDGFGSAKKLSVGDLTWFGGVNFEF